MCDFQCGPCRSARVSGKPFSRTVVVFGDLRVAKASGGMDGKKIGLIAFAVVCVGVAGYITYTNFFDSTPPPLPPAKPEETKTSEPAPLPPNVARPKPG